MNFHFQIQFMLLFSRQGKCRLQKWFVSQTDKNKKKITRELIANVLTRKPKMCSFLEWKDLKIVYKRYETSLFGSYNPNIYQTLHWIFRYASLYFCAAVEQSDNELVTLEIIHRYVELLDKYFGSVRFNEFIENISWNWSFFSFLGLWAWYYL